MCDGRDCCEACFGCGGSELSCEKCYLSRCLQCLFNGCDIVLHDNNGELLCDNCKEFDNEIDRVGYVECNPPLIHHANDVILASLGHRDPTYA